MVEDTKNFQHSKVSVDNSKNIRRRSYSRDFERTPYIQMHDNPARITPYRWKKNHMWPIRNSNIEFYMGNMVKYGFTVGDARTLDNIKPEVNRM